MFTSNEYITKLSRGVLDLDFNAAERVERSADFLANELRVLVVMQPEDFRRAAYPCRARRTAVYCSV